MADKTPIEWTDATWTPIRARWFEPAGNDGSRERVGWHCEHVSEGCRNCYSERINRRLGTGFDFKPGHLYRPEREGYHNGEAKLFLDEKMLTAPLRWRRPRMIFVCSMTDLFADFVPDAWIDRVFAVMALCPQHTFQVLTKRSARMRAWFSQERSRTPVVECIAELYVEQPDIAARWPFDVNRATSVGLAGWPLPNVWLGVSAEDQTRADERVPDLLATPAAVRFVSAEPLLGPIDFEAAWHGESALDSECWGDCAWCEKGRPPLHNCQRGRGDWEKGRSGLDWIIVGGESGPGARPMHSDWARSIRDQCVAAGVAFFFKQWGEWLPGTQYQDLHRQLDPSETDSRFACMDWDGERYEQASSFWADEPSAHAVYRVGKKIAGRLLDGVTHDAMPVSA